MSRGGVLSENKILYWKIIGYPDKRLHMRHVVTITKKHFHTITWMQKSPLMVPGLESLGLVSPSMTLPVATTLRPSQTMARTGPDAMYLTSPAKKGLEERSA